MLLTKARMRKVGLQSRGTFNVVLVAKQCNILEPLEFLNDAIIAHGFPLNLYHVDDEFVFDFERMIWIVAEDELQCKLIFKELLKSRDYKKWYPEISEEFFNKREPEFICSLSLMHLKVENHSDQPS
jgi:hypothetical protein